MEGFLPALRGIAARFFRRLSPGSMGVSRSSVRRALRGLPRQSALVICKHQDALLVRAARPDLRMVLWSHNLVGSENVITYHRSVRAVDAIVVPTRALYESQFRLLEDRDLPVPVYTIRHLVDRTGFPTRATDRRAGRPVRLVHLGGENPKKGRSIVLEALRLMPGGSAVEFLSAGSAEPMECKLPNDIFVKFLTRLDRRAVRDLLASGDIGLVPSAWFENSPTAILEMMATGLAVIGSRVGGIPELLGDGGVLVDHPNDPFEWAEAIRRLVEDEGLRRRLGEMARERTATEFDDGEILDRWALALRGGDGSELHERCP